MAGLLCVGDIMVDVVVALRSEMARGSDSPAAITTTIGGTAVNVAAWAAWAGAEVRLVGCVGDDGWDERIGEHLERWGVDGRLKRQPGLPTGMVVVLAHPDGERSMFPDARANSALSLAQFDDAWDGVGWLYISGYTLLNPATNAVALALMAEARRRGCRVCLDPASAAPLGKVAARELVAWLHSADLVVPNELEFAELAVLAAHGPEFIVKYGAAGAEWQLANGERLEQPAAPAEVVDTVGAGDSFAGGLLAALLRGAEPAAALAAAVETAGKSVSQRGAQPPAKGGLK